MAYETGTTGSIPGLVSALISFAGANGFALQPSWAAGGDTVQPLLKDGIYFLLQYNSTELSLNTCTSVTGAGATTAQPGAAPLPFSPLPIAPPYVSYHLFCDGQMLHCAVEVATNVFTHINFGVITKNGSWIGGAHVGGSRTSLPSTSANQDIFAGQVTIPFHSRGIGQDGLGNISRPHLRTDNTQLNGICGLGSSLAGSSSTVFNKAWLESSGGRPLVLASPNAFNGRSVIVPITLVQATSGTAGPYFQLGNVPNAGVTSLTGLQPKDVVNTDWMVFPVGQRGTGSAVFINSFEFAMAYKK